MALWKYCHKLETLIKQIKDAVQYVEIDMASNDRSVFISAKVRVRGIFGAQ